MYIHKPPGTYINTPYMHTYVDTNTYMHPFSLGSFGGVVWLGEAWAMVKECFEEASGAWGELGNV